MIKTKKVLSIILISLLILSTILTLCKKVGLCASGGGSGVDSFTSFPLAFGNGQGISDSEYSTYQTLYPYFDAMLSWANAELSSLGGPFDTVVVPDDYGFDVKYVKILNSNNLSFSSDDLSTCVMSCPSVLTISIDTLNNTFDSYGRTSIDIDISQGYLSVSPSGSYMLKEGNLYCYPIYCTNPENISDYFSSRTSSGGHTKGGVLSNYIDSEDLLEDSSDIPSFDFSPPTTQQGFWDKLFGFFSRSFKTFNSWLLTIGDLIGQVIDKLEEVYNKIEEFFGRVFETIFSWLESIFDKLGSSDDHLDQVEDNTSGLPSFMTSSSSWMQNFWLNFKSNLGDFVENNLWGKLPDFMKAPFRIASWFYNHGLNNGEFDFLSLWEYLFDFDSQTAYAVFQNNKYGDFILDVRDFFSNFITSITGVTASDRVFFNISLGDHFGVYIPDIEIDFDWYASIRDQYLPYFMAFLYVTVIWLFFKRLPDILKGVAGAESSFMDNLPREYDTYETIFSKDVVTTIETHSNRSRSGAVIDKTISSHKR